MDYFFLTKTNLFRGTTEHEAEAIMKCLSASTKTFHKGETIFRVGDVIDRIGMVLDGSVNIESDDIWGNRSILDHIEPGFIFGETYACIGGEPMLVSAMAAENTTILFMNVGKLISTCPNSCAFHNRIIQNLLQISAGKNLKLSRRIMHTSSKSIRGRLLSYFSEQAQKNGSYHFTIPFNRQQLADYLNVDRSAMSNELSKMKADGILDFEKNTFTLRGNR